MRRTPTNPKRRGTLAETWSDRWSTNWPTVWIPLSALPAAGHESSPNGVISGEKLVFRGTFLRLSRI